LRELRRRGHVVGSHSCSHPTVMRALSFSELLAEWHNSVRRLTDILGEPVPIASVPGGYYSRSIAKAAAQSGIQVLFNSEPKRSVSLADSCLVIGRFAMFSDTPASVAARLASGHWSPILRQKISWYGKKTVKRLALGPYLHMRRFWLG